MKNILIVDDSKLWLEFGTKILSTQFRVSTFHVADPMTFVDPEIAAEILPLLEQADVLLCDKDLGALESTSFLCQIRLLYPHLPIIRWTGGWDNSKWMQWLGVSAVNKPSKKTEAAWLDEIFSPALNEQEMLVGGPEKILLTYLTQEPPNEDGSRGEARERKLVQLREIAELAEKDRVTNSRSYEHPWMITGRRGDVTKHELGHAICDGDLTADDIRPLLPALQKVVAKFRAADEIDERFSICAEFLEVGNLDELELVQRCY